MPNEEIKSDKPDAAKSGTDLAVERTVMAADRSLMAWVRTGISLISFGFTIYKFLEYASEKIAASGETGSLSSPQAIGLYLIGTGILSLIFGTIENLQIIKSLRGNYDIKRPRYSLIMSGLITIFGLVLFFGILFRMIQATFLDK